MMMIQRTRGFTLLEVLLAIVFITALAAIPLLFSQSLQERTNLRLARTLIVHSMYEAQSFARAGHHDTTWGVKVLPERVVVFEGTTYADRVVDEDRSTTLPREISIAGDGFDEIVFDAFTGEVGALEEISVTIEDLDPEVITIEPKGLIY